MLVFYSTLFQANSDGKADPIKDVFFPSSLWNRDNSVLQARHAILLHLLLFWLSQAEQELVFSAGLYSGQVSSNMGYKTPEQVNP